MDITLDKIKILYEVAKKVYVKELTQRDALIELQNQNINRNSANDYLYCYACLVEGRLFNRTMNIVATKYFLEKILEDNGIQFLLNALQSLSLHIDYYENISGHNVVGRKQILADYLKRYAEPDGYFSEEFNDDEKLKEGLTKKISVNIYERNPIARKRCIEYYGAKCKICDFDFEEKYGEIGKGFIHVHHLVDIATIGKEYEVDFINDLIPVCPNCHAMLHKRKPAYSIDEIKMLVNMN